MKTILAILFTWMFILTTGFGQDYFPFPDSNALWRVDWMTNGCFFSNIPEAEYQYVITGDTTIGNFTYNKIERSGLYDFFCPPPIFYGNGYTGAFRNDIEQKKVYLVLADSINEIVFYDFNLSIGDTLKGYFALDYVNYICQNPIVVSIDSILIGTNYRKRYEVAGMMCSCYIIEGIGSTAGLIEPMSTMEETGNLVCFKQSGQTLYPDTNTLCSLVTVLPEKDMNECQFRLYPNPARQEFQILGIHQLPAEDLKIEILDIMGNKMIFNSQKISQRINVNTNYLSKGIYQVLIFNRGQLIGYKKIAIN